MQGEVGSRCSPGLILMWHQLVHQNLLYLPSKSQETTKQQIMFFLEALWHKVLICCSSVEVCSVLSFNFLKQFLKGA